MKQITFSYRDSARISSRELSEVAGKLQEEIQNMKKAVLLGYDDDRASINLPHDREMLSSVEAMVRKKRRLKPLYLVVVGIGGSNLGTMAVQEAVLGTSYNLFSPETKILYADTVDSDSMKSILRTIEPLLEEGGNVLINGVSKSGATTETVANFEILVEALAKSKKDYEEYVVITTDKDSKLWYLALKNGFGVQEIPKRVGGRYSVFSPVGVLPLGIIGVKIDSLLEGAAWMRDRCLNEDLEENPASLGAALLYLHHKQGKSISDLFLFSNDLESVGKWFRQLMAESIGKEYNRKGERIFAGITPTVSTGSTDLHSMAQLYLGGPYDKFTTFVRVGKNNSEIAVPDLEEYSTLVSGIQKKPLSDIMDAILEGVKVAFGNGKRPFAEITLPDKSEASIGQLLQLEMMEMMYLGALLGVNPFDQPNVEMYKSETRKILGGRA